jgi:energy-coupling factor transporter ATP-binding protein EcfA2
MRLEVLELHRFAFFGAHQRLDLRVQAQNPEAPKIPQNILLVGANGSGKSNIFRAVNFLVAAHGEWARQLHQQHHTNKADQTDTEVEDEFESPSEQKSDAAAAPMLSGVLRALIDPLRPQHVIGHDRAPLWAPSGSESCHLDALFGLVGQERVHFTRWRALGVSIVLRELLCACRMNEVLRAGCHGKDLKLDATLLQPLSSYLEQKLYGAERGCFEHIRIRCEVRVNDPSRVCLLHPTFTLRAAAALHLEEVIIIVEFLHNLFVEAGPVSDSHEDAPRLVMLRNYFLQALNRARVVTRYDRVDVPSAARSVLHTLREAGSTPTLLTNEFPRALWLLLQHSLLVPLTDQYEHSFDQRSQIADWVASLHADTKQLATTTLPNVQPNYVTLSSVVSILLRASFCWLPQVRTTSLVLFGQADSTSPEQAMGRKALDRMGIALTKPWGEFLKHSVNVVVLDYLEHMLHRLWVDPDKKDRVDAIQQGLEQILNLKMTFGFRRQGRARGHPGATKVHPDQPGALFTATFGGPARPVYTLQELSGGQVEVLCVLLALHGSCTVNVSDGAQVILLDEPGSNLHPSLQARLRDWIFSPSGRTAHNIKIVATHTPNMVNEQTAHRIVRLQRDTETAATQFIRAGDLLADREHRSITLDPLFHQAYFSSGVVFTEGRFDRRLFLAVKAWVLSLSTREKSDDEHLKSEEKQRVDPRTAAIYDLDIVRNRGNSVRALQEHPFWLWEVLELPGGKSTSIRVKKLLDQLRVPHLLILDFDSCWTGFSKVPYAGQRAHLTNAMADAADGVSKLFKGTPVRAILEDRGEWKQFVEDLYNRWHKEGAALDNAELASRTTAGSTLLGKLQAAQRADSKLFLYQRIVRQLLLPYSIWLWIGDQGTLEQLVIDAATPEDPRTYRDHQQLHHQPQTTSVRMPGASVDEIKQDAELDKLQLASGKVLLDEWLLSDLEASQRKEWNGLIREAVGQALLARSPDGSQATNNAAVPVSVLGFLQFKSNQDPVLIIVVQQRTANAQWEEHPVAWHKFLDAERWQGLRSGATVSISDSRWFQGLLRQDDPQPGARLIKAVENAVKLGVERQVRRNQQPQEQAAAGGTDVPAGHSLASPATPAPVQNFCSAKEFMQWSENLPQAKPVADLRLERCIVALDKVLQDRFAAVAEKRNTSFPELKLYHSVSNSISGASSSPNNMGLDSEAQRLSRYALQEDVCAWFMQIFRESEQYRQDCDAIAATARLSRNKQLPFPPCPTFQLHIFDRDKVMRWYTAEAYLDLIQRCQFSDVVKDTLANYKRLREIQSKPSGAEDDATKEKEFALGELHHRVQSLTSNLQDVFNFALPETDPEYQRVMFELNNSTLLQQPYAARIHQVLAGSVKHAVAGWRSRDWLPLYQDIIPLLFGRRRVRMLDDGRLAVALAEERSQLFELLNSYLRVSPGSPPPATEQKENTVPPGLRSSGSMVLTLAQRLLEVWETATARLTDIRGEVLAQVQSSIEAQQLGCDASFLLSNWLVATERAKASLAQAYLKVTYCSKKSEQINKAMTLNGAATARYQQQQQFALRLRVFYNEFRKHPTSWRTLSTKRSLLTRPCSLLRTRRRRRRRSRRVSNRRKTWVVAKGLPLF